MMKQVIKKEIFQNPLFYMQTNLTNNLTSNNNFLQTLDTNNNTTLEKNIISSNNLSDDYVGVDLKSTTVTVKDVKMPVVNGDTIVYINADDGVVYKQSLSENETLILVEAGDSLEIGYVDTDIDAIKQIINITKK